MTPLLAHEGGVQLPFNFRKKKKKKKKNQMNRRLVHYSELTSHPLTLHGKQEKVFEKNSPTETPSSLILHG